MIEKVKKEIQRQLQESEERLSHINARGFVAPNEEQLIVHLKGLLSFISTLEVKRVDLEKVFNDEYSKFSNDTDAMDYAFPIDLADFKDFAKHFFELGLKAQKGE